MNYRQIREAAEHLRNVPLPWVLEASAARTDPQDKSKWLTLVGHLSVSGAKFYNFTVNQGGGGAIDLAMHLHDLQFVQAVHWLDERFPGSLSTATQRHTTTPPRQARSTCPRALRMPERDDRKLLRVRRYLTEKRGLPLRVIDLLIRAQDLYADVRANAVFVLRNPDQNQQPIGAELRGTTPVPWRGLAPGSRKDAGYFGLRAPDAKKIVLCESAIDAISCFSLDQTRHCISTAGARSSTAWLNDLLATDKPVFCAFDADTAGDQAANLMVQKHPSIKRLRSTKKDWNEQIFAS